MNDKEGHLCKVGEASTKAVYVSQSHSDKNNLSAPRAMVLGRFNMQALKVNQYSNSFVTRP